MYMMNPTLEDVKTQCDSQVFRFPKREKVEVPASLSKFLLAQLSKKGIFIVPDREEDFEKAHYEGLRNYLNGTIKTRIQNYLHEQDEYKRNGVTLQPSKEFERALRYQKELSELLHLKAPVDPELSYLDLEEKKIEAAVEAVIEKKSKKEVEKSYKELVA